MEERTPDTTIAIGDRVKSYDFAHRDDCYVEGIVQGFAMKDRDGIPFDCRRYIIKTERWVSGGEERPLHEDLEHVYPPVNGTETWMGGVTAGVVRV